MWAGPWPSRHQDEVLAEAKANPGITEIGGTVGDIESQPFLEAAREVRRDLGADNLIYICFI